MEKTIMTLDKLLSMSKEILDTLPKAHYLKTNTIKVTLSVTSETSYFDPIHFEIVVSFRNIAEALKGCEALTAEAVEAAVRGFTYHELSHAMLTPTNLYAECDVRGVAKDLANVIEDERIETILAKYYLGVDFKALAKATLEYREPHSFEEWVFVGLRLRKAPFGLAEMLREFGYFMEASKGYHGEGKDDDYQARRLAYKMAEFVEKLRKIYKEHKELEEADKSAKGGKGDEADKSAKGGESGETAKGGSIDSIDEAEATGEAAEGGKAEGKGGKKSAKGGKAKGGKSAEVKEAEEQSEEDIAKGGLSEEEAEKLVKEAAYEIETEAISRGGLEETLLHASKGKVNEEAKVGMLKAIVRNKGLGHATAPTIASLNGKLNIKRYIKDQHLTMKWFDKSLGDGDLQSKKCQKKVLNLWLDQSGSFSHCDEAVNKILMALDEIERTRDDFEFNLIKMTCTVKVVAKKSARYSDSHTGNALPVKKFAEVYSQVNKTFQEVNIVLFDGRANSLDFGYRGEEVCRDDETYSFDALKVFDNKRTIFITEHHNECIKHYCPNARDVIIEDKEYASALTKNIVRAFDMLF
jgi:DNA-binding Lrp family transcriptional regulator